MIINDEQVKLLARALYEMRLLLGNYLGSNNDAPQSIREAAHLAYALHNEAQAVLEGNDFDLEQAQSKIHAIARVIPGSDIAARIL